MIQIRTVVQSGSRWLLVVAALLMSICKGGVPSGSDAPSVSGPPPGRAAFPAVAAMRTQEPKSVKRGIAYDLEDPRDFAALSPGVSWWYNWSPQPSPHAPAHPDARFGMDFYPMLWGPSFDADAILSYLRAHRQIRHLLVLNEPNITSEANVTPEAAAELWPRIEALARAADVDIVGPAMTWGTMEGYADPVVWLDDFYAAYRSRHGRDPRIDFLAFHWYDYGLADQLDRLRKFGKRFWVTEFANWHSGRDGGQIDSPQQQARQMADMVETCEARADVVRYAWFIGRWSPDPHYTSLLGQRGELTPMGKLYLALPFVTGMKE